MEEIIFNVLVLLFVNLSEADQRCVNKQFSRPEHVTDTMKINLQQYHSSFQLAGGFQVFNLKNKCYQSTLLQNHR